VKVIGYSIDNRDKSIVEMDQCEVDAIYNLAKAIDMQDRGPSIDGYNGPANIRAAFQLMHEIAGRMEMSTKHFASGFEITVTRNISVRAQDE
jgi:hypothetical protein